MIEDEDREYKDLFSRGNLANKRSKYKIEVRLAKRTTDWTTARIDLWVNGRMLAGGGDDHMFICGYKDCMAPIPSERVGSPVSAEYIKGLPPSTQIQLLSQHWAVCPKCEKAGVNNHGKQAASVEAGGYRLNKDTNSFESRIKSTVIKDPVTGASYPCITDCLFLYTSIERLAEVLCRFWDEFKGDADIYLKYHPDSIRVNPFEVSTYSDNPWDSRDVLVIYPMENIIKDTSAGASLQKRFEALLRA